MSIILKDKKIELRKPEISDKTRLAELANNKRIWDNLRDYIPHPYKPEDAVQFIKLCEAEIPQRTFAICFEEDLVGIVGLVLRTDVYRKSAEIGYWIGEPYWNKGIAEKAVNLIVAYGFNSLNLIRIDAGIFAYNKASVRVLEKCGFQNEGVFRSAVLKNNKVIDELRFAVVRSTYSINKNQTKMFLSAR